ncbi:hypothetical protein DPSP01_007262 [Paraphaeosphaeria sporulosa]|uniref:Uncharacterized protein n=1 Tax=Paraphaeosphaeria sporulosa TaxID=1460663 RepID=A0A177C3R2_9PLEO|nr:uncharacterized protein CC84DRAFT_1008024 [Paraphaeosphaeria sporulosa]OAG02263.1 hypothetical protein CC84DRAFT_1008024 [Paraphaeosphaeria sporulosa]
MCAMQCLTGDRCPAATALVADSLCSLDSTHAINRNRKLHVGRHGLLGLCLSTSTCLAIMACGSQAWTPATMGDPAFKAMSDRPGLACQACRQFALAQPHTQLSFFLTSASVLQHQQPYTRCHPAS